MTFSASSLVILGSKPYTLLHVSTTQSAPDRSTLYTGHACWEQGQHSPQCQHLPSRLAAWI